MSRFFIAAIWLLCWGASADPLNGPSLTVRSNFYNSSDNLDHRNSKVIFLRQGKTGLLTGFGADAEMVNGEDDSTKYDGTKFSGLVTGQFAEGFGYSLAAGINRLRSVQMVEATDDESDPEPLDDHKMIPYYEAALYFEPNDNFESQIKTSQDYIYNDWIDAAAVGSKLVARKTYAGMEFRPLEKHAWRNEGHFAEFDDGNSQTYLDTVYFYEIVGGKNSIVLGPGASYFSFAKSREDFVLAKHYTAWSLRSEAEFSLGKDFSTLFNLSLGRGREDKDPQNYEYWAELKLVYEAKDDLNFNLSCARLATSRPGDEWSRTDISVALSAAL